MINALHAVRVPTPEQEALRDLVRARDDVRVDLMRARQRLSKLLLRHDVRYDDTTSRWGERHRAWLASTRFATREPTGEPGATARALAQGGQARARALRAFEATLALACYEGERARRQFDAVEPENRLVARSLETGGPPRFDERVT